MLERFKLATEVIQKQNYQLWQYGNHPEELQQQVYVDKAHSLNPVGAGIVEESFALYLFQCHQLCF
jgi:hypothetical protein